MEIRLKRPLLICLLLLWGMFLRAQDGHPGIYGSADTEWTELEEESWYTENSEKEKFRFKNRMVELSFAGVSLNFSNDFIAASDIFRNPFYMLGNIKRIKSDPGLIYQDPVVINADDFFDGFRMGMGASIKPMSLNFNWKDKWGLGLDIGHIDIWGNLSIPESVLTFKEAKDEKFGAGGAVFADTGIPFFFHCNNFKIKLRPAAYVPVVYTEPNITYSIKKSVNPDTGLEGMRYEINYDMRIYSVVNLQGLEDGTIEPLWQEVKDNYGDILRNLGYDFGLCVEYPLDNLDVGVDIVNIPVPYAGARLNHYSRIHGEAFFDTSNIDLIDVINDKEIPQTAYGYPEDFSVEYGYDSKGKRVYRPFTTLFYMSYRPFGSPILSLIPSLGFSVSRLYIRPGAVEGGLSARFDHGNVLITTLGINYNDRRWKNSIDLALNLRAFEFNIGLSSQSQHFRKSWQGAGAGVNVGFKLGW